MKGKLPKLVFGTFNSERYWQEADLATLPVFSNARSERINAVMDEILWVFCERNDLLFTRLPFDRSFKRYLQSIGVDFHSSSVFSESTLELKENISIEMLLLSRLDSIQKPNININVGGCLPFSVLQGLDDICSENAPNTRFPDYETTRKVNSKSFAYESLQGIGILPPGVIAHSSEEVLTKGKEYLSKNTILIKDIYGVSGRGTIEVTSVSVLERLSRHFRKQERNGKRVEVVIEPLLNKIADFSCHVHISPMGDVEVLGLQEMRNHQFRYVSSNTPNENITSKLNKNNYFDHIHNLSRYLFESGYFGYACFDSLLLNDGVPLPLLEINARQSMGLINLTIENRIYAQNVFSMLYKISFSSNSIFGFSNFLEVLDELGALFDRSRGVGVLPLTARTTFVNDGLHSNGTHKGTLILSIAYSGDTEGNMGLVSTFSALRHVFKKLGIKTDLDLSSYFKYV